MVSRGAVYRVDLGTAKRGHKQRGRRLGLAPSPSSMLWSVATIIPTSTAAPYHADVAELGERIATLRGA